MSNRFNLVFPLSTSFIFVLISSLASAALTVNLVSPNNDTWSNGTNATIEFKFNFVGNGTDANCALYINNQANGNTTALNNTNTSLKANTTLPEWPSQTNWRVSCTNVSAGGTFASETRLLKVDTTPPALSMAGLNNTLAGTGDNVSITVLINEAGEFPPGANCSVTIGGVPAADLTIQQSGSNYNCSGNASVPQGVPDGIQTISVRAVDSATNIGFNSSYVVRVDNGPNVTISYPANNANLTSPNVSVTFKFIDAIHPTANCSLQCNDVPIGLNASTANGTNTDLIYIGMNEGFYRCAVTCVDAEGKQRAAFVNWTVDLTLPQVSPTSPPFSVDDNHLVWRRCEFKEWTYYVYGMMQFNITVVDGGAGQTGIKSVEIRNGTSGSWVAMSCVGPASNQNCTVTLNVSSLPEGNSTNWYNDFLVNATDYAGNSRLINMSSLYPVNTSSIEYPCLPPFADECPSTSSYTKFIVDNQPSIVGLVKDHITAKAINATINVMDSNSVWNITLNTSPDGFYSIDINDPNWRTSQYSFSIRQFTSGGDVIRVSPTMPPMPAPKPGKPLTRFNFFLVPAVTINIFAYGNPINWTTRRYSSATNCSTFSGMVVDTLNKIPLGFFKNVSRIASYAASRPFAGCTPYTIVGPHARSYQIVLTNPPDSQCDNDYCYAFPHRAVEVTAADATDYNVSDDTPKIINISTNFTFSTYEIYGNLSSEDANIKNMNIHKVLVYFNVNPSNDRDPLYPSISPEFENLNITEINASKNFTLNLPPGNSYLLEVFADNTTNYYAGYVFIPNTFANATQYNITLKRLAGAYRTDESKKPGAVNTSKTRLNFTLEYVNETGSTVIENATGLTLYISLNYNGVLVNKIIENLENVNYVDVPIIANYPMNIEVFGKGFAPLFKNLPASLINSNSTISLKVFRPEIRKPPKPGEDLRNTSFLSDTELAFYFHGTSPQGDNCDVINPSSNCIVGGAENKKTGNTSACFNPMQINPMQMMLFDRVNMHLKQTSTGITLYFVGVDLLASGPPDAKFFDAPVQNVSTATTIERAWQFGSMAPPRVYNYVWVAIPYLESEIPESAPASFRISALYDDEGNKIWETANGTANLPSHYSDYPTSFFAGVTCSDSDANATCYRDKTANLIWIKLPHFSIVAFTLIGQKISVRVTEPTVTVSPPTETSVTIIITSAEANVATKINIKPQVADVTGVIQIEITPTTKLADIQVTVAKIDKVPVGTPAPAGEMYKLFETTKKGFGDEQLAGAKIKFKVDKARVIQGIEVKLGRYSAEGWKYYSAVKYSEDASHYYYESAVPGFSVFAILLVPTATPTSIPGVTPTPTSIPGVTPTPTSIPGVTPTPTPAAPSPTPTPAVAVAAAPGVDLMLAGVTIALIIIIAACLTLAQKKIRRIERYQREKK